jgi:hypothetical protein
MFKNDVMLKPVSYRSILIAVYLLGAGCASAELKELSVDANNETSYQLLLLDVLLSDGSDSASLIKKLNKELGRYDLVLINQPSDEITPGNTNKPSAILKIDEINRRLEPGTHRRTYGRTSLTQQRGRKHHEKPVISLQVMLIDFESKQTLFQAEYETMGPWHADSSTVVAALAKPVCEQLADKNLIALQ